MTFIRFTAIGVLISSALGAYEELNSASFFATNAKSREDDRENVHVANSEKPEINPHEFPKDRTNPDHDDAAPKPQ